MEQWRSHSKLTSDRLDSDVINLLRFILSVLVVMIHVDGRLVYSQYSGSWNGGLFDTFHIMFAQGVCRVAVPLFFLMSGFLYFNNLEQWNKDVYIKKEKRRVKSLLIPYIIWNVIALVIFVSFQIINEGFSLYGIQSIWNQYGGLRFLWDNNRVVDECSRNILGVTMHNGFPFNGPLWFLRDLFIVTLMSPAIQWAIRHIGIAFPITLILLMIFNIGIPFEGFSPVAISYFSTGAFISLNGRNLVEEMNKIEIISFFLFFATLIASVIFYGCNHLLYGIFSAIMALAGCSSYINIASRLLQQGRCHLKKIFVRSSFFIFAAQRLYIIPMAVAIANYLLPYDCEFTGIVRYLLSCTIVVTACIGIYSVMCKVMPKTTSILTGGR